MTKNMTITQQEFVRRFYLKPDSFSWLLGAGASLSAGLPTAQDIINDLKKIYYCTEENQTISDMDINISPIRAKIQTYFDSKDCPIEGSWEEYSYYFQLVFGDNQKRQKDYIQELMSNDNIALSKAQRILAALIGEKQIKCLFTTNFDDVVERAYSKIMGDHLPVFHLEGSAAANEAINNEQFPVYVKLHGDFKFSGLKNLESDLLETNKNLGKSFINAGNRYGCIVIGYSGRDKSVMSLFNDLIDTNNPFPNGLYWTTLKGSAVPKNVKSMISRARDKKIDAHIVEIDGFETLMAAIWKNSTFRTEALDKAIGTHAHIIPNIPFNTVSIQEPMIRYNALLCASLPTECYRIDTAETMEWKQLIECLRPYKHKLTAYKSDAIYGWGNKYLFEEAFGSESKISKIDMHIDVQSLNDDTVLLGALEDALCKALATKLPLRHKKSRGSNYLIISRNEKDQNSLAPLEKVLGRDLHGILQGIEVPFSDPLTGEERQVPVSWVHALRIKLRPVGEKCLFIIHPDILITPNAGSEEAKGFKRDKLAHRKNDVLNNILDTWVKFLWGETELNSQLKIGDSPPREGICQPSFSIIGKTIYSGKEGG